MGLVFSQTTGMFASNGTNLMGFEGRYDSKDGSGGKTIATSAGGSYVHNGNIEVAVFYNTAKLESDMGDAFDTDATGLDIGGYYHIKSYENFPFDLMLGGFFGDAKAKADYLDELGWEVEAKGSGIGGGAYKLINQKNAMTIIGFINIHSVTEESKITDSYGTSVEEDIDYNTISF